MRRRILIVLLSLGTVGGYASGFAHLHCMQHHREQALEQHVARVCIEAAQSGKEPAPPPPAHDWRGW